MQRQLYEGGGITSLKKAKDVLESQALPGEFLAYINPQEAAMLKYMGGAGIPINSSGVPSFFIKKIAKGVKSAVKGAVGAVKDFASSDVGKLALLAAGGYYLGGGAAFGGPGFSFSNLAPSALKGKLLGTVEAGTGLYGGGPLSGIMNSSVGSALTSAGSLIGKVPGGMGTIAAVGGALLPSLFGGPEEAKEAFTRDPQGVKNYLVQYYKNLNKDATDEEAAQFAEEQTREYAADGGRIGFAEGGNKEYKFMELIDTEGEEEYYRKKAEELDRKYNPQNYNDIIPKEKPMDKFMLDEVMSERGMNTLSEDTRDMVMKMYAEDAYKKGQISREEYNEIMGRQEYGLGGLITKMINSNPEIFKKLQMSSPVKQLQAKYMMNLNPKMNEEEVIDYIRENAAYGGPMGEPRENQQGVKELDYRQEGGFVPVGIKEKADDVPAMLSKNEFVFTADAVTGAGEGDVEKGAERLYNTMKTLENGGRV